MVRRRWDTDERGIGAADARAWGPLIETIAAAAGQEGWVAEEPEAHLLPHLQAASAAGPLAIRSAQTAGDGAFVVDLEWLGESEPSRRAVRSALFDLVASIAETVTVLHEPPEAGGGALEVLTGSGDGNGPFAGHGHTLRLSVALPPASSSEE